MRKYTKPDYHFKSLVLRLDDFTGILSITKKLSITSWLNKSLPFGCPITWHQAAPLSRDKFIEYDNFFSTHFPDEYLEAFKIIHADYERRLRLKMRVSALVHNFPCTFITLTFRNEYLSKSTEESRRNAIRRFLNDLDCYYIANIDYGSHDNYIADNGTIQIGTDREHYHAIVSCRIPSNMLSWYIKHYGGCYAEKVRCGVVSEIKLAQYINKLVNHAIKDSTKRCALLYSRKHKFRDIL